MSFQPGDLITLLLITIALGVAPLILMTLTSFVKIVVVLNLVRNALGVQQAPPTIVINGLALVLSAYVLQPTYTKILQNVQTQTHQSFAEYAASIIDAGIEPFREFLAKNANERETLYFLRSARESWSQEDKSKITPNHFLILAPAFLVSELTEAFKIGFLLYLAFIVVDLVVANALVALGLSQASPTNIAIPLKLLLFVVLDGWSALLHGLVQTYR